LQKFGDEYLNNIYALLEQISFPLVEDEVLSNYLSKTPGKIDCRINKDNI